MHLIKDIAAALDGEVVGDRTLTIAGATEPLLAGTTDLAVALNAQFLADLAKSNAVAALVLSGTDVSDITQKAVILVPRGRLALARLTQVFDAQPPVSGQRHPTADIHPSAQIAQGVDIGAFTVVGAGAVIGAGTQIGSHVTVCAEVVIGPDCNVGDGCRIGRRTTLGARVRLHQNVVVGSDGFSFVTTEPAHVELSRKTMGESAPPELSDPSWHRIHSLGGVTISDDVEIGVHSTIDAGTLRPTFIGKGTKLDNMVHVGHNVVVGEHCLLCGKVGIAGSAVVGDRTVIGGQAGVADNISIGSDVVIGGASAVLSNVPSGRVMLGFPAVKLSNHIESYKALRRLPRMLARLARAKTGSNDPSE